MNRNMQRVRIPVQNNTTNVIIFLIFLLFSYVITTIGLMILAYILYRFPVNESTVNIGTVVIYVLSTFLSAFFCGKKQKTKKFVWGLGIGLTYFGMLIILSCLMGTGTISPGTNMVTTLFICGASGMLGGMLA